MLLLFNQFSPTSVTRQNDSHAETSLECFLHRWTKSFPHGLESSALCINGSGGIGGIGGSVLCIDGSVLGINGSGGIGGIGGSVLCIDGSVLGIWLWAFLLSA